MYVFIIQTTKDGKKVTASFAYDSYREAEKKFFTEMAYDADGRKGCIVMIIDDNGLIRKQDRWFAVEPIAPAE
mgnify:CR=1 FL=1